MQRVRELSIALLSSLLIPACSYQMVGDLTARQLAAPAATHRFTVPIVAYTENVQTSHRVTGTPGIMRFEAFGMDAIHSEYGRALASALAPEGDGRTEDFALLSLARIDRTQHVGSGFREHDIRDTLDAAWVVRAPNTNDVVDIVRASGYGSGRSGWGDSISTNTTTRLGEAFDSLLGNTVTAFEESPRLRIFNTVPELYAISTARVPAARRLLERSRHAPAYLDATRRAAALLGDPELYAFARGEIARTGQDSLLDESSLFHFALESRGFDDESLLEIVSHSTDLELRGERGLTPIEALLVEQRDELAAALVGRGARPAVQIGDEAYASAELAFNLVEALSAARLPVAEAAEFASESYLAAIDEANAAIEENRSQILANRLANALAPAMQRELAAAEAGAIARSGAATSGVIGFGTAVYSPATFDLSRPTEAIEYLEDRIRHCRERLAQIQSLSS